MVGEYGRRTHSCLTAVYCSDNGCVGKAASGLERIQCRVLGYPLPRRPILGSSNSAANKDMMAKI